MAPERQGLGAGLVWVASLLVLYVTIPAIIVRVWHRESLGSIGWSTRGLVRHLRAYLPLYLLVLPIVVIASHGAAFARTYPFVAGARTDLSTFVPWECAYVVAFRSFWGGVVVHALVGPTMDGLAVHHSGLFGLIRAEVAGRAKTPRAGW